VVTFHCRVYIVAIIIAIGLSLSSFQYVLIFIQSCSVLRSLANARVRTEKHIADLCLLAGDLLSASSRYQKIVHQAQRDTLWFASINESLAVTAVIIQLKEEVTGQKSETPFIWKVSNS